MCQFIQLLMSLNVTRSLHLMKPVVLLTAIKLIVLTCFSQCVVSLLWLEIYRKHLLLTISQVLFPIFNSSCLPFFLCSHPSFGSSCDIHKVILSHSTTMIGTFLKLNTLKISSMQYSTSLISRLKVMSSVPLATLQIH